VGGSGICWAICKPAPHPRQPRQHPTTQFFTGRMPFLPPNQQRQSTEGNLGKPEPEKKTILNFNEARDDGITVTSAGPYTDHLHLTPNSIT